MAAYNKVILIGNLTADPEVRRLQSSGTAVCTLRLAIDDSYQNRNGDKVDRTVFVDCDAWDKQAELCQRFLAKGRSVLVDGRLQMDSWQDRETGKNRSKLKVRADRIVFLGARQDGGSGGGSAYAPQGGGTPVPDSAYDRPAPAGGPTPPPFNDPISQPGGDEDIPF